MSVPNSETLSAYLKNTVADRLSNDYRESDFDKRKVEFLLREYTADASDARRIYTMDAGIDAYAIDEDDDQNALITIWQLSGPDETQISSGRVITPPKSKLESDLNTLADGLAARQSHMSDEAADAISLIVDKIKRAHSAGKQATITIHVLSLYGISDSMKEKARNLAKRRLSSIPSKAKPCKVECQLYGLGDYAAADAGTSGVGPQVDDLTITLAAPNSMAEYSTAYLAFAKPSDLVTYYIEHGAALLHTNARFFLGKGKGTANKAIESSAKDSVTAKKFHELNNGLVITCGSVTAVKSKNGDTTGLKLTRPQVVNGGQTLHTLTEVRRGEAKGKKSAVADLAIPIKIVVLQNAKENDLTERAAEIAKASNTQAALSLRALASYAGANPQLQRAFAKLPARWFFEKTDGEWKAFRKTSDEHRRSITGVKKVDDFQFKQLIGKKSKTTSRILKNSEVLEALLSAYGCFDDATKKRMFEREVHPAVLSSILTPTEWKDFASEKENKRTYILFSAKYPGSPTNAAPARFLLLAWSLLQSVRALSFSEKPTQEWVVQFWQKKFGGPSANYTEWLGHRSSDRNAEVFEFAEHVSNAMQKPIVFQILRLLARRYGTLDENTSSMILALPQFVDIASGRPAEQVLNAEACREANIGEPTTPIYTLYQLCRHACGIVYQGDSTTIASMGTKQQTLLGVEWVKKLSNQVDALASNLEPNRTKLLTGSSFVAPDLGRALPDLDSGYPSSTKRPAAKPSGAKAAAVGRSTKGGGLGSTTKKSARVPTKRTSPKVAKKKGPAKSTRRKPR